MKNSIDRERKDNVRWDLFCTVVDNFGDIGVCWRLARQLSNEYGTDVRLWVDNLDRLRSLCDHVSTDVDQQFVEGIEVCQWKSTMPHVESADVVIEAFACQLPETYLEAMSLRALPPVWINLEYLSAEDWVEGCHLLPSPQFNKSLRKVFFFPGFTKRTGGLLRESDLLEERAKFDRPAALSFLNGLGIEGLADHDELIVSLFCYQNSSLPELLQIWSDSEKPIRLLATPGYASEQVGRWFGESLQPGMTWRKQSLTVQALPFLSQTQYDRLLWSCDLNFARGEDSFVRAQWAQRPFVWQIYPQSENAHEIKLDAFLKRYLRGVEDAELIRRLWLAWNGLGEIGHTWKDFAANRQQLEQHGKVWAAELDQAGHLADNLVRFVCGNHFTG